MPKETIKYPKGALTVVWKPGLCIHSRICWKNLPAVFNPKLRPWINVDGADAETIKAQVLQCPSGALSLEEISEDISSDTVIPEKNETTEPAEETIVIECQVNGPLKTKGKFLVKNTDGTEVLKEGILFLCRCGGSANKPFCDGTHRKNGFIG